MTLFLLLVAIAAIVWAVVGKTAQKATEAKLRDYISRCEIAEDKLQDYDSRYKPAIDIDLYVRQGEELVMQLQDKERQITAEIRSAENGLARIHEELALARDAAFLAEIGYYEPRYDFEEIASYEAELQRIREKQKAMLREDGTGNNRAAAAAFISRPLSFNNSTAQGRAAQKKTIKLMLRAFNGETDSFIARVNYRNVDAMEKRVRTAFDAINEITQKYDFCEVNTRYLDLRLQELQLVYEWEEAKQREKEEQAKIREQIREEEKAAREAEKAKQQADKEEAKYLELLQKAEKEVQQASEKDKASLNAKILELQERIAEIEEKKRAISQAMLTKTGHVYIISNVGSFGENVYKIGMTRRLEPMDRVKELGDASVPFPFDVHAMIRTSDAPGLERALHKHFDMRRLNLENDRKEFFHVSIDEINQELEQLKIELGIDSELRLTLLAEAKEFRMSEAKRKHLEATYAD
jgi:hypothetical protein